MATYYVDLTGNDSNPGTIGSPFLTIQAGVNAAVAGDTVSVNDGTWLPTDATVDVMAVNISQVGTSGNPITIKATNNLMAVLDGNGTALSYFNFLAASAWIVIDGFEIKNTRWGGLWANSGGCKNCKLQNSYVHAVGNRVELSTFGIAGIYTDNAATLTVDNCRFAHVGRSNDTGNSFDHSIYSHGTLNIINNVFCDALSGWHIVAASSFGGVIRGNWFFGPNEYAGTGGLKTGQIMLWDPEASIVIDQNIFYDPRSVAITHYDFTFSSLTITNNQVYGSSVALRDFTGGTDTGNTIAALGSYGGSLPCGSSGAGTAGALTGGGVSGSGGSGGGGSTVTTAPGSPVPQLPFLDSVGHYSTQVHMLRKWTSVSGFTYYATGGRFGSYACSVSGMFKTLLEEVSTVAVGMAYSWDNLRGSLSGVFNRDLTGDNANFLALGHVGDGRLRLVGTNGFTTTIVNGFIGAINNYYYIECKYALRTAGGYPVIDWEVHVDNAVVDSGTITGTISLVSLGWHRFTIASIAGQVSGGETTKICDIYISNGEFFGDGSCRAFFPASDGTYTDGVPSSAGAHYLMVKEHDPDDVATTIELASVDDKDSYAMDTVSGFSTIKATQFLWCGIKDEAGLSSFKGIVRLNSTDYETDEFFPNDQSYLYYIKSYRLSPDTGLDFTQSELNSGEVGEHRIT